MQQILRVQASAKILQNQTSKWIIYRSFRLNTLSMNLSVGDKLRSVSNNGHIIWLICGVVCSHFLRHKFWPVAVNVLWLAVTLGSSYLTNNLRSWGQYYSKRNCKGSETFIKNFATFGKLPDIHEDHCNDKSSWHLNISAAGLRLTWRVANHRKRCMDHTLVQN